MMWNVGVKTEKRFICERNGTIVQHYSLWKTFAASAAVGGNSSALIRASNLSSALCSNQFDESWINTISMNMKTENPCEYDTVMWNVDVHTRDTIEWIIHNYCQIIIIHTSMLTKELVCTLGLTHSWYNIFPKCRFECTKYSIYYYVFVSEAPYFFLSMLYMKNAVF